jgi:ATP-dependent DNA helicase RecG
MQHPHEKLMPESHNVEWKQSWRDEYLKWVSGFANTKGGKLCIGIDDKGNVSELPNIKNLLEDIPNKIQNYLGIICSVSLLDMDGKQFIEIDVPPYDTAISYHGKYYFRTGSTNRELTGNSLIEFLLKKSGKTWGDVIEPSATIDAISPEVIEHFKQMAIRWGRVNPYIQYDNIPSILENLRLVENGKMKRSAILIFGKNPNDFFPTAKIQIGKFGKSDTDLLFQDRIECNALQMTDEVIKILDSKYFKSEITYKGLQRLELPDYPEEALREVLRNAIVHRNYLGVQTQVSVYDDKLIVWNDGELPEGLTVESLKRKHITKPRNHLIAEVFFKAGQIEAYGRGTLKIIEECAKNNLPEPDFQVIDGGVQVTLYRDAYQKNHLENLGLNERQIKAVLYVKENGKITNSEYQKINNVSKPTATRDLREISITLPAFIMKGKGSSTAYILSNYLK